ncbi:taste receptor type 2 member 7-like [Macrotis lagotis]|uniref:taste receptor type 2 member 7-like n=1 Tax=Macrotis lagotis TaxID=92651 RepID=UPI003D68CD19
MGTLINTFIVLVCCIDWVKRRKFFLVDSIFMSLALVRIFLHWITVVTGVVRIFYKDVFASSETLLVLLYLTIFSNNCSISLASCLIVFYFLKIAHFSHHLFLWFKRRINKVILMILLGSLIIFLFLNLILMKEFREDFIGSMKRKEVKNHTRLFQMESLQFNVIQSLFYFGHIILLLMSLISCFLLILSLWRHTRQMQFNATGFRDPSTEAHIRVMRWMVSYLFLVILYYLNIFIIRLTSSMLEQRLVDLLGIVMGGFYPLVHSFILILGNSKLKQASIWMWHQTLLCLQGGKP